MVVRRVEYRESPELLKKACIIAHSALAIRLIRDWIRSGVEGSMIIQFYICCLDPCQLDRFTNYNKNTCLNKLIKMLLVSFPTKKGKMKRNFDIFLFAHGTFEMRCLSNNLILKG